MLLMLTMLSRTQSVPGEGGGIQCVGLECPGCEEFQGGRGEHYAHGFVQPHINRLLTNTHCRLKAFNNNFIFSDGFLVNMGLWPHPHIN